MQDVARALARVQRLRMYYNESNNDKKLGQKPPDPKREKWKTNRITISFYQR